MVFESSLVVKLGGTELKADGTTPEEIIKLLDIIIGKTNTSGDCTIDMNKRLVNTDKLGEVTFTLMMQLLDSVETENRNETSMREVGKKARYWIDNIKDYLG